MRLHPPGTLFARVAQTDEKFGEYDVPKGARVLLNAYWIQVVLKIR